MTEPSRESERRRPVFDDQRDDYDDDFAVRWTPWEKARRRVLGPAIAFVVIGTLGILGTCVGQVALLIENLDRALAGRRSAQGQILVGATLLLLGTALSCFVIAGGVNLLRMRRRWLGLFAAYVVTGLSLVPFYSILFYPFGIWGLVVLYRPDVREQFRRPPPPRDDGHGEL
jgi:hypothetical protein